MIERYHETVWRCRRGLAVLLRWAADLAVAVARLIEPEPAWYAEGRWRVEESHLDVDQRWEC